MKKGKVRKVGNSLGFTLPSEYARLLDLREGEEVCIRVCGEKLIIEPFNQQLLEQMEAYRQELSHFKHTFKALE